MIQQLNYNITILHVHNLPIHTKSQVIIWIDRRNLGLIKIGRKSFEKNFLHTTANKIKTEFLKNQEHSHAWGL